MARPSVSGPNFIRTDAAALLTKVGLLFAAAFAGTCRTALCLMGGISRDRAVGQDQVLLEGRSVMSPFSEQSGPFGSHQKPLPSRQKIPGSHLATTVLDSGPDGEAVLSRAKFWKNRLHTAPLI
ncbi:hypothetical protein CB1_001010033 [Camelus ferus]|nr:hypothetical protein CB1_001010033 [Camelus ferus]